MKKQKGFLLVVAVILICTIAILGVALAYIYTRHTDSSINIMSANQAFYIATSGLETAKHNIGKAGVSCNPYPSPYNGTISLFNGQVQVTGRMLSYSNTLSVNIDATTNTIPVSSNISNWPAAGIAQIGTGSGAYEIIVYHGRDANHLLGVTRGFGTSIAVAHNSGATVTQQNACLLTSVGGVPTLGAPRGKRAVSQQILLLRSNGYLAPGKSLPGNMLPAAVSLGNINLQGSATITSELDSGSLVGCAMMTNGIFVPTGSSYSSTCHGSTEKGSNDDQMILGSAGLVDTGSTVPAADQFYSYFFENSISEMSMASYNVGTPANVAQAINNAATSASSILVGGGSGTTTTIANGSNILTGANSGASLIIVNGNLNIGSNVQIGSLTNPIKIIVLGTVTATGNADMYSFIYATGNINLQANAINIYGAVAAVGSVNITASNITFTQIFYEQIGTVQIAGQVSTPEVYY